MLKKIFFFSETWGQSEVPAGGIIEPVTCKDAVADS